MPVICVAHEEKWNFSDGAYHLFWMYDGSSVWTERVFKDELREVSTDINVINEAAECVRSQKMLVNQDNLTGCMVRISGSRNVRPGQYEVVNHILPEWNGQYKTQARVVVELYHTRKAVSAKCVKEIILGPYPWWAKKGINRND